MLRAAIDAALDVVLPLTLLYGLRLAGANQWLALVIGSTVPLLRLTVTVATQRRDVVPLASTALLAVLLVIVVRASKAYGRRHLELRDLPASQQDPRGRREGATSPHSLK